MQPPLRAGGAYEDIADALGVKNRGVAEEVVTRVSSAKFCKGSKDKTNISQPPLRAGGAYEDIADALGVKRDPNFEIVKVVTAAAKA